MMRSETVQPYIDPSRCKRCGICVETCPCHAVTMGNEGPVFDCPHHCSPRAACHRGAAAAGDGDFAYLCEEICPNQAISWSFEIVFEDEQDEQSQVEQ